MKDYLLLPLLFIVFAGLGCRSIRFEGAEPEAIATEMSATHSPAPPLATATVAVASHTPVQITATILPSPTPNPTMTALPTATMTPSPTATLPPWHESSLLGHSLLGQPIEQLRIGNGDNPFVIIAALHGGHECNTRDVVQGIVSRLTAVPTLLPANVTLYAIPIVNPDGCTNGSRTNANQVDLNRNWATNNWLSDAEGPGGIRLGSGGTVPFSEPETALVREWLAHLINQYPAKQLRVISYHSVVPQTGLVQPGYSQPGQPHPAAVELAQTYADATGYLYSPVWVGNYTITGEFINWANEQGIIAVDVELPDRNDADTIPTGWSETHIETNLHGLLTVIEFYAR